MRYASTEEGQNVDAVRPLRFPLIFSPAKLALDNKL